VLETTGGSSLPWMSILGAAKMRLLDCAFVSLCLSWMMQLGIRQDFVDVVAQKKLSSHCTNFFLRPDDDDPRVNAGRASQTTVERELVLEANSYSSLP
jgi:hypothetical protein